MSPIYEYRCANGHSTDTIRKFVERDGYLECPVCGSQSIRVFSAHHAPPDGVYSYAPNIGDPNRYEQQQERIKRKKETGKYD